MKYRLGPHSRLRINSTLRQYASILIGLFSKDYDSTLAVSDLERQIERRVGRRHCIAVPMARTGIYATIKALIQPGQEVILSPYTIADVINMVVCAGGVPVFADLEPGTCNVARSAIKALISDRTGAVMITHFYGLVADVEGIRAICRDKNIPLVEDAAQAFGAVYEGTPAGSWGDVGIYSFGAYKNVNSFLGGAVVTDDDDLARKLRAEVASWPLIPKMQYARKVVSIFVTDMVTTPVFFSNLFFFLFRFAFLKDIEVINRFLKNDVNPQLKTEMPNDYRVRMSGIQALQIAHQLSRKVEDDIAARIEAARAYYDGLSGIPEIGLPPLNEDYSHAYWYFPIQVENRHDVVAHAMREGRDITMSYHRNCAALQCFAQWARPCPEAERTANSVIYLPTYPRYGREEVAGTIRAIRSYYRTVK